MRLEVDVYVDDHVNVHASLYVHYKHMRMYVQAFVARLLYNNMHLHIHTKDASLYVSAYYEDAHVYMCIHVY